MGPRDGLDGCGIQTPNRTTRNETLNRLSYPRPTRISEHKRQSNRNPFSWISLKHTPVFCVYSRTCDTKCLLCTYSHKFLLHTQHSFNLFFTLKFSLVITFSIIPTNCNLFFVFHFVKFYKNVERNKLIA